MEFEILVGLGLAIATAVGAFWLKSKKSPPAPIPPKAVSPSQTEPVAPITPVKAAVETKKWTQRLSEGLSRARLDVWGKLAAALGSADDSSFEAAEEILYTADLPPQLVADLIQELKRRRGDFNDEASLKTVLAQFLSSRLDPVQKIHANPLARSEKKPKVIMIVGVNGAGKTTTIGKLAAKLAGEGNKVLVGACDTFRAAAVDQLQVWCDRAGAEMVRAKDGADPSGVAYDTVARAVKEGHDFCLVDTAGRLHTATGLMDELAKTKRVMSKVGEGFPHEVWLVIDAITGQNALKQAQEFHKALGLTGLVFTKCDGSAKAGSAVGIVQQLQVPITYIGVGETVEDLQPFVVKEYVEALVGLEKSL
jgi:fused signal recognition particle receptor